MELVWVMQNNLQKEPGQWWWGAELRRGGLMMVKVQTTLREAQRNERESQGEGTQVGEEGLW